MTLDLFDDERDVDFSRRHGTCPCGESGRLWLLKGELRCTRCVRAAEEELAREAEWRAQQRAARSR